jgi:NitT/TauT family transport system substrate-binding protein
MTRAHRQLLQLPAIGLAAFFLGACAKPSAGPAPTGPGQPNVPVKLTLQLDWVAEPEHGGFYQALAKGFYKDAGLDVTIIPGGPAASVKEKISTGQADIGQADSTNTLEQIAEGLPLLMVGAVFQDDPSGLLVSAGSSVHRFEDLQGKTVIARPEWAFLGFIQKKYGVTFNLVPQNFSVAAFLGNQEAIQQGYSIAEPYHIVKAGGQAPRFLSTWEAGFRAYAVLITNKKFAREHPDTLRAFLKASAAGWRDYLTGDPAPAQAALKAANPDNTDEFMAASRQLIIDNQLVTGRGPGSGPEQIGRLDPARFQTQIDQLEALGLLPKGKIKVDDAMTTAFLP